MDILKYLNRPSLLGDGMFGSSLLTRRSGERAFSMQSIAPGGGAPERGERAEGSR
jgi:hypothetical protein